MGLHLRRMLVSDAETLASWAIDSVFCAHAGWTPQATVDGAVAWWRESLATPDPLLLRLMAVRDGEPVGYVDLHGRGPIGGSGRQR